MHPTSSFSPTPTSVSPNPNSNSNAATVTFNSSPSAPSPLSTVNHSTFPYHAQTQMGSTLKSHDTSDGRSLEEGKQQHTGSHSNHHLARPHPRSTFSPHININSVVGSEEKHDEGSTSGGWGNGMIKVRHTHSPTQITPGSASASNSNATTAASSPLNNYHTYSFARTPVLQCSPRHSPSPLNHLHNPHHSHLHSHSISSPRDSTYSSPTPLRLHAKSASSPSTIPGLAVVGLSLGIPSPSNLARIAKVHSPAAAPLPTPYPTMTPIEKELGGENDDEMDQDQDHASSEQHSSSGRAVAAAVDDGASALDMELDQSPTADDLFSPEPFPSSSTTILSSTGSIDSIASFPILPPSSAPTALSSRAYLATARRLVLASSNPSPSADEEENDNMSMSDAIPSDTNETIDRSELFTPPDTSFKSLGGQSNSAPSTSPPPKMGGPPPSLPPLPSWCGLPTPHNTLNLTPFATPRTSTSTPTHGSSHGHGHGPSQGQTKRLKVTPLSSPSSSRAPRLAPGDETTNFTFTNVATATATAFPSPRSMAMQHSHAHPFRPQSHSPPHAAFAELPAYYWELQPIMVHSDANTSASASASSSSSSSPSTSSPSPPIRLWSKPAWVIGRHTSSDHICDHISISRHHARLLIHVATGQLYLQDLNSTHGTFVDGERITSMRSAAANGSCQLPLSTGGVGSFALASTPSLSTAGAFPLTKGCILKFGASQRQYRVWLYESIPDDSLEFELASIAQSHAHPIPISIPSNPSAISSAPPSVSSTAPGTLDFSSSSPPTVATLPNCPPPALRKSCSDGSIPSSPALVQQNGTTATAVTTTAVTADGTGILFIPAAVTQSKTGRLPSSLINPSNKNVQRKRKSVSFALSAKTKDGCSSNSRSWLDGSRTPNDSDDVGVAGDGGDSDDDDDDARPKRQGLTAEEITHSRRAAQLALAAPVPILKLPVFAFASRASSAPQASAATLKGIGRLPTTTTSVAISPVSVCQTPGGLRSTSSSLLDAHTPMAPITTFAPVATSPHRPSLKRPFEEAATQSQSPSPDPSPSPSPSPSTDPQSTSAAIVEDESTDAIYSALLPQPMNSVASPTSFTSLSLISSSSASSSTVSMNAPIGQFAPVQVAPMNFTQVGTTLQPFRFDDHHRQQHQHQLQQGKNDCCDEDGFGTMANGNEEATNKSSHAPSARAPNIASDQIDDTMC